MAVVLLSEIMGTRKTIQIYGRGKRTHANTPTNGNVFSVAHLAPGLESCLPSSSLSLPLKGVCKVSALPFLPPRHIAKGVILCSSTDAQTPLI